MCWLGFIPPRREEGPALGVSTSLACIRVVPPRSSAGVDVVVVVVGGGDGCVVGAVGVDVAGVRAVCVVVWLVSAL